MSKNTKQTSSKVAHLAATTLNDNKSSGIAGKKPCSFIGFSSKH